MVFNNQDFGSDDKSYLLGFDRAAAGGRERQSDAGVGMF